MYAEGDYASEFRIYDVSLHVNTKSTAGSNRKLAINLYGEECLESSKMGVFHRVTLDPNEWYNFTVIGEDLGSVRYVSLMR